MADYEYDTLTPIGGRLINTTTLAKRKSKIDEALRSGKVVQIADGVFIFYDWVVSPEVKEWIQANKGRLEPESSLSQYTTQYRGATRIAFRSRQDTLMFKLVNEITRI